MERVEIKLNFSEIEVNLIIRGLRKLPHEESDNLIKKISNEVFQFNAKRIEEAKEKIKAEVLKEEVVNA